MVKNLCVIGLGYIGLPTSVVFADNDWQVTGVDVDNLIVDDLNIGKVRIKENGLDKLVEKVVENGSFIAKSTPEAADVFIIAVPTPHDSNLKANLSYIKDAIKAILPVLKKENVIIIESTIPPRTTRDEIAPILYEEGFLPGNDIYLAHCPERVLPGNILKELYGNNRIVGGINSKSAKKAADVYRTFVNGKVIETSLESAEMSKLMENTYRDVNIALANELTKISEKLSIDALEVIELANEHPRVNIHQPGPGVGGHCLAIDPYFIIEKDNKNSRLISESRKVNESMPDFVIKQVEKVVSKNSKISVFGLSYKGNVDDVRESPSIKIINQLLSKGYNVKAYDPYVKKEQVAIKLTSFEDALNDSELLLILTDHKEFKKLKWEEISKHMKSMTVMDTKNCVENVTDDIKYYNFGNLYNLIQSKDMS